MLEQIGGECAGAITFIDSGAELPKEEHSFRNLTESELADTLRQLPRRPLLAGEDGIRLSLAGAQSKLAVRVADGKISIPLGGAPSTHILKPANSRFELLVENEALCMKLAARIGIPTAKVEMHQVEDIPYLLIERYDRIVTKNADGSSETHRLHQEDFCQAYGIDSEHKYQREGGPSLSQCFDLVRRVCTNPVTSIQPLLDGVFFNCLIGNNDAHGKNFSLLYTADGRTQLAPFYDLVSTQFYPDLTRKMAMKLGGEYDSAKLSPALFEDFAIEAGLNKSLVKQRIKKVAADVIAHLATLVEEIPDSARIAQPIQERTLRFLE